MRILNTLISSPMCPEYMNCQLYEAFANCKMIYPVNVQGLVRFFPHKAKKMHRNEQPPKQTNEDNGKLRTHV